MSRATRPRRARTDPFGHPLEVFHLERRAEPRGLHAGRRTAECVRVELRRDPLAPAHIAYVAPHRATRRGLEKAPSTRRAVRTRPCGCPLELEHLLCAEPTRFRAVPGHELSYRDSLGHLERFTVLCTTVMGNASPAAPHQFMIVSTREHHLPLHRRPLEEVIDLLRVMAALTAEARTSGAATIQIIKNRGPFAGGSLEHPHWQARLVSEDEPRPPRGALSVAELARKESALGQRVFFRGRTGLGQVVGWRSYAGFESNIAVLRCEGELRRARRTARAAHWICDLTEAERRRVAEAIRLVCCYYEVAGIGDYNVVVEQPPLGSRAGRSTDIFRIIFTPRGPGYQPAGFEIASDYHVTFVSESPEAEARRMRELRCRLRV